MSKDCTLVVLAAGMGSRYGGLKQLDPVGPNDEAILDYSVFDAARAGFNKVVFIIREDFKELFKEKVTNKYKEHIKVDFVFQDVNSLPKGFDLPDGRTKPWGTAHAMLAAKDAVNEPFAIINADDFYGEDAYRTVYDYLSNEKFADASTDILNFAMLGFRLNNTLSENGCVARGICKFDENRYLTSVEELTKIFKTVDGAENRPENGDIRKLTGKELVSMNFWAFTPDIFPLIEKAFKVWLEKNINVEKSECYIPEEIDKLIKANKVAIKVLDTNSKWFGVTYKEDKPKVVQSIQKLIELGKYPNKLFA